MNAVSDTEFELDTGTVRRTDARLGVKPVLYPFDDMEVGTSFRAKRQVQTLKYAIRKYREMGHKERHYSVRPISEGEYQCRVWRVK